MKKKPRNYQEELAWLDAAQWLVTAAHACLMQTRARMTRRKIASLKKSLQGAINNARVHGAK